MKKIFLPACLLLLLLTFTAQAPARDAMRVAFINPDPQGSQFWQQVTEFMQAVAQDLDVHLDVYYGDRGRFTLRNNFLQALDQPEKPDYIITILHRDMGLTVMEAAEASGVKVFVINTDIPESLRTGLGRPREKFTSWIGHLFPDDEQGGYDLAKILADTARARSGASGPPFGMIGITGSRESSPGISRRKGAVAALETTPDILLKQMVYAYWDRRKAFTVTPGASGPVSVRIPYLVCRRGHDLRPRECGT